ncbi:hypothetical protein M1L60_44400 [Actinoplanes sp. TRM 88003]|uniref:Uncharacterized protein n=1 Tax=Paractinoplanes aksuensis TaxID=2939490 RepID=A0ABT1E5V5_9ACTN|nr:hypothetical protein [Actinoplanes aksuensis]MCO8277641.1 hypothetical protein [Actinoplanes aksuensis]
MLTVSSGAAVAVQGLLARPGVPAGSCLRIQMAAGRNRLRVLLVSSPCPGDLVFDIDGRPALLVAAEVAERVGDQILMVRRSEAGRMQFVLDATAEGSDEQCEPRDLVVAR